MVVAQRRARKGRAAQIGILEGIVTAARRTGEGGESARDEGRAAVALLVVGANQVDREVGCRGEAQRAAQAELVLRIELFLLACGEVLDITVARTPFERQPSGDHIVAGIEIAAEQRLVEIAVAAGDLAREAFARTRRDEADRANRRGGAEQRRLRALDDLDPLEIVDRLVRPARTRDVDAVVIERDARPLLRGTRIRGDPADDDAGVVGALLLDVEPRNIVRQLVEIGDAEFFDPVPGHRRNGDRHILRALFDLLRSDDDRGAAGGLVRGRHLLRQQRSGNESDGSKQGAAKSWECHGRPLSLDWIATRLAPPCDTTAAKVFQL